MVLTHIRLHDNQTTDTIGMMFYRDRNNASKYLFTLENIYREKLVWGVTRIPAGTYPITMQKAGELYTTYSQHPDPVIKAFTLKWGVMLLNNVPGFAGVEIHTGNEYTSTKGCLLCGDSINNNSFMQGFLASSVEAYKYLLDTVDAVLSRGEGMSIKIVDDQTFKAAYSI